MEKLYDLFERYRDYILVFVLFIILVVSEGFLYHYMKNISVELKNDITEKREIMAEPIKEEAKSDTLFVDVKGEVSSPGVYSFEAGKRVIDAIKKAGGLTPNADTSVNNLGKKLTDEMVIIIYSKKQVKKMGKIFEAKKEAVQKCNDKAFKDNSCLKETDVTEKNITTKSNKAGTSNKKVEVNGKVSINSASKEELMTLTGIGEAKAKNIIEYRSKTKFNSIEDIKKVKGIGDSIFEKIKNNIEL